ncbi:MAG: pyridoxamine 5'-phosphate oxidase family protein [Actinobacteria bacterium]|nr:pyridoxamine 5'-phosphate oxidase family protein [Actinomycetota bacterium]
MTLDELIEFVRERLLAVVSTVGPEGNPQSALVGVAATEDGEILFDTDRGSRKARNLMADPRVSLVVGWDDEYTVQLEGVADVLQGAELTHLEPFYFQSFATGRERSTSPDLILVRVRVTWGRVADYRHGGSGMSPLQL